MQCEAAREKLTAYLDGELEGERGSALRGHLRGCADCRQVASDEAALRDGLRALPPVDPPPSLWAGVQQRLAAEEVADSERPAWGRMLSWLRPRAPQIGFASVALAAACVFVAVRSRRDEPAQVAQSPVETHVEIKASHEEPAPTRGTGDCNPTPEGEGDVTVALAAQPAQITSCYDQTARELLALQLEARQQWSEERKRQVDTELASLQHAVKSATDERPRQRAYRDLIRYLQRSVIRDDVAFASMGGTP